MGDHADIDHTGLTGVGGSVATDAIFDAKGDLPVGTGADTAAALTVGANDTILMADSGQATGLKWVAAGTPTDQDYDDVASAGTADTFARGDHLHGMPSASGGGVTDSYLGYNTMGGTAAAATANYQYMKQITPSGDKLLVSIGCYLVSNAEGVDATLFATLNADNGGSPREALAMGTVKTALLDTVNGAGGLLPRWFHIPIGYVLSNGTPYWIGFGYGAGGNWVNFYRDGSGTDVIAQQGGLLPGDSGYFTESVTTDRYSIRALVLDL